MTGAEGKKRKEKAMAHMQKFTRATCGHMFNHYERKEGDGVKRGNGNIDGTRTHLNYNLAKDLQPLSGSAFLRQRLDGVKCLNRKDVNVMIDWVVTKPGNVPDEKERDFFRCTFDFLRDRYGDENIISSYVHLDETAPHMHTAIVPIVPDEKTGGEKVCAKEFVDRDDLATFHDDLADYLEPRLGFRPDVVRSPGARDRTANLSLDEYKRQQSEEKIAEQERRRDAAVQTAAEAARMASDAARDVKAHEAKVKELNEKIGVLSAAADAPYDVDVKERRSMFGRETVEVSKDDWNVVKAAADKAKTSDAFQIAYAQSDFAKTIDEYDAKVSDLTRENAQLRRDYIDASNDRRRLRSDKDDLQKDLDAVTAYALDLRDALDGFDVGGQSVVDWLDDRVAQPAAVQRQIEYERSRAYDMAHDWDFDL